MRKDFSMEKSDRMKNRSNKSKNFIGTVVSVAMLKTAKVEVAHMKKHPLYKKALKKTKRFACHNELSDIAVGDNVEIRQVRPVSRTKNFSVVKKIA